MASTWLVFSFGVSFTMDTILFTLETPSSLEMSHLYLSRIHGKTRKCVSPLTKTMLMHIIATSCWISKSPPCDSVAWRTSSLMLAGLPAVYALTQQLGLYTCSELANGEDDVLSSLILSSRLQKHCLFMRNLEWKSMSSNSVRGFVRSRNNLGRLGLN